MSEINVERPHSLGLEEARRRVSALEAKLQEKFGVRLSWNGDQAEVKGTGVSGQIEVTDTRVQVRVKLGLLLRPMAAAIRETLERQLVKALG